MLAQHDEDFLFWLYSTRVSEIQINDVTYFIQTEPKLLQLVNFPQPCQRLLSIVVLAVSLTLTRRDQPNTLIIANRTRSYLSPFRQITYTHALVHYSPQMLR